MTRVAWLAPWPRASQTHSDHGLGGVAAYAKNLASPMTEDLLVYAPHDEPSSGSRRDGHVEVREVDRTGRGIALATRALAADPDIEVVHAQFEQHLFGGPLQNLRLALDLRRLSRTKRVVMTVHQVPDLAEVDRGFLARNGFPPVPPILARAWMRLQYMLLAFACHLLVVHEERQRDVLVGLYGLRADKVAVVPHGIDQGIAPCSQGEARSRLGIVKPRVILYFGYVTGYKGVDLLVGALEGMLEHERAATQVVIAGKVPERKLDNAAFRAEIDDLERRIGALGAWVTRRGFLSQDEIALHLAAADVVVFPYRHVFAASGPLSIAMGHGRPFLASDAFRGMGLPDEALFPIDPEALAGKLRAYFADERLRASLEAEARRLARERAWPRVAASTASLYAAGKTPRVLLMGAYGQDNLGDEALLEVHLQQLADMRVTVGSTNPAQTARRYGVPAVRTYGGLGTIKAFLDSDAVVFGGGSVVKELPRPYPRHKVVASLALLSTFAHGMGRGVAYSAVGVEKISTRTGRACTRRLGRAADLIQVRDEGSRRLMRSLGVGERVSVVADAAYLLAEDAAAVRRANAVLAVAGSRPVIVLNPISSHESGRSPAEVAAAFTSLVNDVQERLDAHVVLLPFKTRGEDNDVDVVREIARRAAKPQRVTIAPDDLRPAEALALLRRATFVVAMRHHGVLLSLVAGAPVLPVSYAPKTDHLVEEFGLEVSLLARELAPASLRDAFWRAWPERRRQVEAAKPTLDEMRARATQNFETLRAFLRERA